ncbi:hypothetical protein [Chitinimonas sp. BJYL2]|uniref:hypothetical protein n=1 Tax=Chitinimonas sp. BJYL2 TaxID=2976696 RepID=UPI0022B3D9B1|nr:hypothetical protein [Chitinimonas sp. BJYL2]
MPTEVITEFTLVGQRPGEAEFPVHLTITKPIPSEKMSPAWECSISAAQLWETPFTIYGEDSFQALCLACRHSVQILDSFTAHRGTLKYPSGESFEAGVFGFKLLGGNAP